VGNSRGENQCIAPTIATHERHQMNAMISIAPCTEV